MKKTSIPVSNQTSDKRRDADDLNSLIMMTTYVTQELSRIAPWTTVLAGLLRSTINAELSALQQGFILPT